MGTERRQSVLSICLVEAIHFYVAQLYNDGVAVLNKRSGNERILILRTRLTLTTNTHFGVKSKI